MSEFTVVWWQAADDELLRLWLDFPVERSQISEASREIDRLLSVRPDNVGVPVHEGLYALDVEALRVLYSIDTENRMVRVWTVRRIT